MASCGALPHLHCWRKGHHRVALVWEETLAAQTSLAAAVSAFAEWLHCPFSPMGHTEGRLHPLRLLLSLPGGRCGLLGHIRALLQDDLH